MRQPRVAPILSSVKTSYFGELDVLEVGEPPAIGLHDGGIHGVQGHTIEPLPDGWWRWQRRLDGMRPAGRAGSGSIQLDDDERRRLAAWSEAAWSLAPRGRASFFGAPAAPPRWVWAIVLRRGEEVRVLEGGGVTFGDEPAEVADALAWLRHRVDALACE